MYWMATYMRVFILPFYINRWLFCAPGNICRQTTTKLMPLGSQQKGTDHQPEMKIIQKKCSVSGVFNIFQSIPNQKRNPPKKKVVQQLFEPKQRDKRWIMKILTAHRKGGHVFFFFGWVGFRGWFRLWLLAGDFQELETQQSQEG